jgi:peptide/nickel transport system substrate-binding protein
MPRGPARSFVSAALLVLVALGATACGFGRDEEAATAGTQVTDAATIPLGSAFVEEDDASTLPYLDGGFPPLEPSVRGGTLRMAVGEDDGCWNGLSLGLGSQALVGFIGRGLYGHPATIRSPAQTRLLAVAAADMPLVTDDGRTLTIRLRPGLVFPDGTPVDADAVKRSLEYMLDPRTQCPGGGPVALGAFDALVGLDVYLEGVAVDDPAAADAAAARGIAGIEAPDAGTLVLRLAEPDPWLPYALAEPWAVLRAPGASRETTTAAAGLLGPYRIDSYSAGALITVERERGWEVNVAAGIPERPDENLVDAAELALGVPSATQLAQLRVGEIDLSLDGSAPAGRDIPAVADDPALRDRLFSTPADTVGFLVLRADRGPLSNPALRRAVDQAIDRRRVARLLGGPLAATPWSRLLPAGLMGAEPVAVEPVDRRAARARVRAATDGLPPALTVTSASDAASARIATAVARDLRRVGFVVTRTEVPPPSYAAYLRDPGADYDVAIAAWGPAAIDASTVLGPLLVCGSGMNVGGFCATAFDERYAEIAALPLGDARNARFARLATTTGAEEVPLVPLVQRRRVSLVSERVGNYRWGPVGLVQLGRIFLRTA